MAWVSRSQSGVNWRGRGGGRSRGTEGRLAIALLYAALPCTLCPPEALRRTQSRGALHSGSYSRHAGERAKQDWGSQQAQRRTFSQCSTRSSAGAGPVCGMSLTL